MADHDTRSFHARDLLHRGYLGLLDALYPRVCRHCDIPLPENAPRQGLSAWFCQTCLAEFTAIEPPYCSVCGEPFDGAMTGPFRCSNCIDQHVKFDFAIAAYKAHGPLRQAIHAFKYGRDLSLCAALTDTLQQALKDPRLANEDLSRWLLVPVPLHWTRQFKRGFNQSWELCRRLSRQTGIPTAQVLRRHIRTRTQTRLERERRLANLRRAFSLRRSWPWQPLPELRGRQILLVDDVLTTGATAHECAKILKQAAGVEKVVVITAARG